MYKKRSLSLFLAVALVLSSITPSYAGAKEKAKVDKPSTKIIHSTFNPKPRGLLGISDNGYIQPDTKDWKLIDRIEFGNELTGHKDDSYCESYTNGTILVYFGKTYSYKVVTDKGVYSQFPWNRLKTKGMQAHTSRHSNVVSTNPDKLVLYADSDNALDLKDAFRGFRFESVTFKSNTSTYEQVKVCNLNHAFTGNGVFNINLGDLDVSECEDFTYAFANNNIVSINDTELWDMRKAKSIRGIFKNNFSMFEDYWKSCSIAWNLENCTNADSAFADCEFQDLRIDGLKFGKPCTAKNFFKDCEEVESHNLEDLDTRNLTNMDSFLENCSSIKKLDTSKWDLSSVTSMCNFAKGADELIDVDLTGLNTAKKLEDFSNAFHSCTNLEKVNAKGVECPSLVTLRSCFEDCYHLKSADFSNASFESLKTCNSLFKRCLIACDIKIDGVNIPNCTDLESMFDDCRAIAKLDLSTVLIKKPIKAVSHLFRNAHTLHKLDISNWDFSEAEGVDLFVETRTLKTIKCPSKCKEDIFDLYTYGGRYTWKDSDNNVTDKLVANSELTKIMTGNKPVKEDISPVENPYPSEEADKDRIVATNYTLTTKTGNQSKLQGTKWEGTDAVVEECNGTVYVVASGSSVVGVLSHENDTVFIPKETSTGVEIKSIGNGDYPVDLKGAKKFYSEASGVLEENCFTGNDALEEVRIKTDGDINFKNNVFDKAMKPHSSLIIENAENVTGDIDQESHTIPQFQTNTTNLETVKAHCVDLKSNPNLPMGVRTMVFDTDESMKLSDFFYVWDLEKISFVGGGVFDAQECNFIGNNGLFEHDWKRVCTIYIDENTTAMTSDTAYEFLDIFGGYKSKLILNNPTNYKIGTINVYDMDINSLYSSYSPDYNEGAGKDDIIVRNNMTIITKPEYGSSSPFSGCYNHVKVYNTLDATIRPGFLEYFSWGTLQEFYVNKFVVDETKVLPEFGIGNQGERFGKLKIVLKEIVDKNGEVCTDWKWREFSDDMFYTNKNCEIELPKTMTQISRNKFQQTQFDSFNCDLSNVTKVGENAFIYTEFPDNFELCFDKPVYVENGAFMCNKLDTLRFKNGLDVTKGYTVGFRYIDGIKNIVFDDTDNKWYFTNDSVVLSDTTDLYIGEGCLGFMGKDIEDEPLHYVDSCFVSYGTTNGINIHLPASFEIASPASDKYGRGGILCTSANKLTIADGNTLAFNNHQTSVFADTKNASRRYLGTVKELIYPNTAKNFSNTDLAWWADMDVSDSLHTLEVRGVNTALVNKQGYDMVTTHSAISASPEAISAQSDDEDVTDNSQCFFYDLINKRYDAGEKMNIRAHDNSRFKNTLDEATENGRIKDYNYTSLCDYKKFKTVKPTYDKDGYILYRCDVCGAIKKEILPRLSSRKVEFSSVASNGEVNTEAIARIPLNKSIEDTKTISVEDNTVSISGESMLDPDKSYAQFSMQGYDFDGWYADRGLQNEYNMAKPVTNNTTIYAKLSPTDYNITYHTNGGILPSDAPTKYTFGDTVDLPIPTRKGYDFDGWYQGSDFRYKVDKITSEDWGDMELYAKWKVKEYNITYDLNGGSFNGTAPDKYTIEKDITIPTPVKPGNNFKGWTGTSLKEPTKPLVIKKGTIGDKNYKANWEVVTGPAVTATPPAVTATPAAVTTGPTATATPVATGPTATATPAATGPTATATPAATVTPTKKPEEEPTSIPWDDPSDPTDEPTDEPTEEEENLDDPTPKSTEKPKKPSKTPRVTKKPDGNNNTDGGEPTYRPVHSKEPVKTPQTGDNYSSTLMIAGLASGLLALISALTLVARRRFRRR